MIIRDSEFEPIIMDVYNRCMHKDIRAVVFVCECGSKSEVFAMMLASIVNATRKYGQQYKRMEVFALVTPGFVEDADLQHFLTDALTFITSPGSRPYRRREFALHEQIFWEDVMQPKADHRAGENWWQIWRTVIHLGDGHNRLVACINQPQG